MPTDEQLQHWAAIRANPKDDAPRLAYADWLDDEGQSARAEFIRTQCELAKLGPDRRKGRKQRAVLEPIERKILDKYRDAWLAPFRSAFTGAYRFDKDDEWLDRLEFRRGFLNGQHLCLEATRRLAEAGDDLEPVDHVVMFECGALLESKSVRQIAGWTGAGCILKFSIAFASDKELGALLRSKSLRNLSHLGAWSGKVSDEGIAKLAKWKFAGSLRSLDLKNNPITNKGAYALADSTMLGQLERIQLHETRIGARGRKRLVDRFGDALSM